MNMENIVLHHLGQNTMVMQCPNCKREYFGSVEKDFIREYGICLGCDKRYCDDSIY